jgi:hypothetical protein
MQRDEITEVVFLHIVRIFISVAASPLALNRDIMSKQTQSTSREF